MNLAVGGQHVNMNHFESCLYCPVLDTGDLVVKAPRKYSLYQEPKNDNVHAQYT